MERRRDPVVDGRGAQSGAVPSRFGLANREADGDWRDHVALGFTKTLRFCADTFFAKRYGHRAIVLETVAAVPGMVGATISTRLTRIDFLKHLQRVHEGGLEPPSLAAPEPKASTRRLAR